MTKIVSNNLSLDLFINAKKMVLIKLMHIKQNKVRIHTVNYGAEQVTKTMNNMHGTNSTCILSNSSWLKSHTKSVRPRQLIKKQVTKTINNMHGTDSTCILTTSSWLKSHTKSVRPRQIIKIRKGINYKDNKPEPSV